MSVNGTTLNDRAWYKLFEKYDIENILEQSGEYKIKASEINEFREARLMTKFDFKSSLPEIFMKNKLSILPISRGDYIIGNFNAYEKLPEVSGEVINFEFPENICSINYENITSEAMAINCAHISGILKHFLGEEMLFQTVNGRMSSGEFSFNIDRCKSYLSSNKISVKNAQVEIDGGYEGINSLTLIEAKNTTPNDFLVRQIYYPYRLWQQKIGQFKEVRTIYMTYTNGIYNLYEYRFDNGMSYNSLNLIKNARYSIGVEDITFDDIYEIYKSVDKFDPEVDGIPFPQADNFNRVVNICELLYERSTVTRDEITNNYDFNSRQTNYYIDACRYLGLVNKSRFDGKVCYKLSKNGNNLFRYNIKKRNLIYTEMILRKKAFYLTFKKYIEKLNMPEKSEIVTIMEQSALYNINSIETYERRSSTVRGWVNWIIGLIR